MRPRLTRSRARRRSTARAPVALPRGGMSGGTYPLLALADGCRRRPDGHVPDQLSPPGPRARPLLRSLGVTHVLFDRPLSSEDDALASSLREHERIGPYTFARLDAADGRPVGTTPSFETVAPGRVEVRSQGRGDRLQIPVAPYRKWRAHGTDARKPLGGRPLSKRTHRDAARHARGSDRGDPDYESSKTALAGDLPARRAGPPPRDVSPAGARTRPRSFSPIASHLQAPLDRLPPARRASWCWESPSRPSSCSTVSGRSWRVPDAAAPGWDDVDSVTLPPAVRDLVTKSRHGVRVDDLVPVTA